MTAKPFHDDLGWEWKAYAGRWLLVTNGGGQQVILSAAHHSSLRTRDLETGVLRDISPSDHVSKIIAAAPDVRRHAQALMDGAHLGLIRIENIGDPRKVGGNPEAELATVLTGLRIALAKSGM
jgi:hypothetical protein